jgi:hypothetical protein
MVIFSEWPREKQNVRREVMREEEEMEGMFLVLLSSCFAMIHYGERLQDTLRRNGSKEHPYTRSGIKRL